jgi:pantetheine-phosphate adenylyltransferase
MNYLDRQFKSIYDKDLTRFYHRSNHIEAMLKLLINDRSVYIDQYMILKQAVIYHDIIYKPFNTDTENVNESIEFFGKVITLNEISYENYKLVCDVINYTDYSKYPIGTIPIGISDDHKFYYDKIRECDLSLITYLQNNFDVAAFIDYEQKIFKENSYHPFKDYYHGRIKILTELGLSNYIPLIKDTKPEVGYYVGSFNPFHIGHRNVLEQARKNFDKIVLVMARNPLKQSIEELTIEDKRYLVQTLANGIDANVEILQYDGLITDLLKERSEYESVSLIRGLRNVNDLNEEINLRTYYKEINNNKTIFNIVYYLCDPEFQHISSSALRQIKTIGANEVYNKQVIFPKS